MQRTQLTSAARFRWAGRFGVGAFTLFALASIAPAPRAGRAPDLAAGRALFERHCAVCHGMQGRGDGRAAYLLDPPPRDFGSGRFRLVSTANGVPTQADLVATIKRGMPGSAMPPWEWMAEEDLWNVALYVRHLSIEGQVNDMLRWAQEQGEELTEAQARAIVEDRMVPGKRIEVPAVPEPDPVTLERGRRKYVKICAPCHGESGTGDSPVNLAGELKNEDGTPNVARDFTAGIFKGGSTPEDIMRRILAGLPGSPMPATRIDDPDELGALAVYVRSLVKPAAEERVLQRRRNVLVERVGEGELPLDPADPRWERAEATWIALMPLWWRNERVEGVVVRALHDGKRIAVRLSWRDASANQELIGAQAFSDNAALEISVERDPPIFAMGQTGHPTDIVLWRAAWEQDATQARRMRDRYPWMVDDHFPELLGDLAEQAITARAVGNVESLERRPSRAETLMAQGFGTLESRPTQALSWTAHGRWTDGFWDVVFTRPVDTENEGEPTLEPGLSAYIAFAVWDGAFRDRNGQKSVSVWHRLQVAP